MAEKPECNPTRLVSHEDVRLVQTKAPCWEELPQLVALGHELLLASQKTDCAREAISLFANDRPREWDVFQVACINNA